MEKKSQNLITKPPVVVILGHVDHGKTSILDFIRKTKTTEKEVGGITQHIGAYEIEYNGKKITFIDTPGHEAFSQMRSRGAKVADIAVLVVAADEGVKPQTKEAIFHIKKTDIPLIVAINKIDKNGADPEKVKRELTKENILVESIGGKIPSVNLSAKTGEGIEDLLELILLLSEIENLKTDISKPAKGIVIECCITSQRGPMATLILEEGKLKKGDIIGTASSFGKIRTLEDFRSRPITEAFPSQPILISGLENPPRVGEEFRTFSSLEEAKLNIKTKIPNIAQKVNNTEEGQKVIKFILRTDVAGSLEAIEEILENLPQDKVSLKILKKDIGEVTEKDIKLAIQSNAKILAFRVKTNPTAELLAEREKIKIMNFDIIYELVESVRKYMEKFLEPEIIRTDLGKIKVLVIFLTEKNRQIVGGKVLEGEIKNKALIEILRNDEIKIGGKIINLQKNKKDIDKASKGEEVGILYEGNTKIEIGDTLIVYIEERRKN